MNKKLLSILVALLVAGLLGFLIFGGGASEDSTARLREKSNLKSKAVKSLEVVKKKPAKPVKQNAGSNNENYLQGLVNDCMDDGMVNGQVLFWNYDTPVYSPSYADCLDWANSQIYADEGGEGGGEEEDAPGGPDSEACGACNAALAACTGNTGNVPPSVAEALREGCGGECGAEDGC